MKSTSILLFYPCLVAVLSGIAIPPNAVAQSAIRITTLVPGKDQTVVGEFEKLELGLTLSDAIAEKTEHFRKNKTSHPEGINPYNPEEISVEGIFTSPSGEQKIVHGFYLLEFDDLPAKEAPTLKAKQPFQWRIRFAPTAQGKWESAVRITTKLFGVEEAKGPSFEVVASENPGFVVRGHTGDKTDRYLRFSKNGDPFFAIGENIAWNTGPPEKVDTRSEIDGMIKYMTELADAGGNFFRIATVPWSLKFEWDAGNLNNYNPRHANLQHMDRIMEHAQSNGLYMLMFFDLHDEFHSHNWNSKKDGWPANPYHTDIPGVVEPEDFFSGNATAEEMYKRKLRYITARWGYSTSFAIFELLSEVDGALKTYNGKDSEEIRKNFHEWYVRMSNFIKQDLNRPEQLISVSFASHEADDIEDKIYPFADLCFKHKYTFHQDNNWHRFSNTQAFLTNKSTLNKPTMVEEASSSIFPSLDSCSDLSMRNQIWSSTFHGNFGTSMMWLWDNAVHPAGLYSTFKPLSVFMENEELHKQEWTPERWRRKNAFEVYYLRQDDGKKAIGWAHNYDYWWRAVADSSDCLSALVTKGGGEAGDTYDYNLKFDAARPFEDFEKSFKVQDLVGKSNYKVEFYSTLGEGGILEQYNTIVQTNRGGVLRLAMPATNLQNNSYGFKITLLDQ